MLLMLPSFSAVDEIAIVLSFVIINASAESPFPITTFLDFIILINTFITTIVIFRLGTMFAVYVMKFID